MTAVEVVGQFFAAACDEIREENRILEELFKENPRYEGKMARSVSIFFEHIFVYLAFRGGLRKRLQYELMWEASYPGKRGRHVDLTLKTDDGTRYYVEFKLWTSEDGWEIVRDIDKLQDVDSSERYIFVINFGGNREENIRYLEEVNERSKNRIRCILKDTIDIELLDRESKPYRKNMDLLLFRLT